MALCLMIAIQLFVVFYLGLGDSYSQVFFSEAQRECRPYAWYQQTALQLSSSVLTTVEQMMILMVTLLQIFEWLAMIVLIQTQKDKSLGEILYDHNCENINEPLSFEELRSAQRVSRRREIILKRVFQVLTVVLSIVLVFFQVSVDILYELQLWYSGFVAAIFFALLVSFSVIFSLMHRYHNFEFRKNRKSMIIFMLSVATAAVVDCFILYIDSLVADFNSMGPSNPEVPTPQPSMKTYVFACYEAETYAPAINLQITTLLVPLTNPGYVLCAISLIIYKKTDDILQGISKLDYLLKVSVFQIYKDRELEKRKFSIISDDSDCRALNPSSVTSEYLNLRLTDLINSSVDE